LRTSSQSHSPNSTTLVLMTGGAEMAPFVTLKRDFRFAPTQMPANIRGRNRHT